MNNLSLGVVFPASSARYHNRCFLESSVNPWFCSGYLNQVLPNQYSPYKDHNPSLLVYLQPVRNNIPKRMRPLSLCCHVTLLPLNWTTCFQSHRSSASPRQLLPTIVALALPHTGSISLRASRMEIIRESTTFETVDGKLKFCWKSFYVRQDGIVYYGSWNHRSSKPTDISQFKKLTTIKTNERGPKIHDTWAVASVEDCYIKAPNISDFIRPDLEDDIQRELEVCEVLRRHPHANITTYYGCRQENGRATGLCFKRYEDTLFRKVNPEWLNKNMFRASAHEHVDDSLKENFHGILEGIKHLHSLGLVHNDINPSNIMLDEHGIPVIIDFGSCRKTGESLENSGVGQTDVWHDPANDLVLEKNDLDAFEELKTWLFGSVDDAYLFHEEDRLQEC